NNGQFDRGVTKHLQQNLTGGSALTRLTLYEMGEITREDITKTVHSMIDDHEALLEKGIIREASLTKMGKAFKLAGVGNAKWQSRWFVLTKTGELHYYKSREDHQKRRKPAGTIFMREVILLAWDA